MERSRGRFGIWPESLTHYRNIAAPVRIWPKFRQTRSRHNLAVPPVWRSKITWRHPALEYPAGEWDEFGVFVPAAHLGDDALSSSIRCQALAGLVSHEGPTVVDRQAGIPIEPLAGRELP